MDEEASKNMMTQALLGDSDMLNAVASLLRQHNGMKEKDVALKTPMLVLDKVPGKESLHANVVLASPPSKEGRHFFKDDSSSFQRTSLMSSFEEVHALATANLVASTQRDIEQQLAQQDNGLGLGVITSVVREKKSNKNHIKEKEVNSEKLKHKYVEVPKQDVTQETSTETKAPEATQPKALTCSFDGCNRKFAWQNHLKYHELTHTNQRQHKCPIDGCGKSFFTSQRLSVHSLTHTGERPFTCQQPDCGKSFTTAGNLKNHKRIHTGYKPFVCDYPNCKACFTEQSSLRKHKRTHTGDKPFQCEKCKKSFTQLGTKNKHMLKHEIDEEIRRNSSLAATFDTTRLQKSNQQQTQGNTSRKFDGVSCSPQVLVFDNYHGLPTSESMVFSDGLTEHIVTVSGQPMEHGLAHTLLNAHGIEDSTGTEKTEELLVLTSSDIYSGEGTGNIVYTTDILDHEEVTHASYTHHYTSDMTQSCYPQHEEITVSEGISQSIHLGLSEYVGTVCGSSKDVAGTDGLHSQDSVIIGAEEVTVGVTYDPSSTSPSFCEVEVGRLNAGFTNHQACSTDHVQEKEMLSKRESSSLYNGANCTETQLPVNHSPHQQSIHMDPLMECD